jgi:hypothetical protein
VRPLPPGWGSQLPPHPYPRRCPALGGVTVLVVVTVLAWLAAPQAHRLRPVVDQLRRADLPGIWLPQLPGPPRPPAPARPPAGLGFTTAAGCRPAGDWTSPQLDRRVRRLLVAAVARYRVRVSCLRSGHARYVKGTRRISNHTVWRAVDVDQVNGRQVSRSNQAARELAWWVGRGGAGVQPSEVGSPWAFGGRPWFTDSGHQGHLHVGFAGPTQAGAG